LQAVTLTRSDASIENLGDGSLDDVADVMWRVETDREGHESMGVSLKYLDGEIALIEESTLTLHRSSAPSGPWTAVAGQSLLTARNEVRADVPSTEGEAVYFALAGDLLPPSPTVIELAEVGVGSIAGARIDGIDTTDSSGHAVSGAGDVNGDGYEDFIVSALLGDPLGRHDAGEVTLLFGGPQGVGENGVLPLQNIDGENGTTFQGGAAGDHLSWGGGVGDVNADGLSDFLLDAHFAAPGGDTEAGEAYLVYGSQSEFGADGAFDLNSLTSDKGVRIRGLAEGDLLAGGVGAGDVNGDGVEDFILGAPRVDRDGLSDVGESYLIFGDLGGIGASGELDLSSLDGINGVRLLGRDMDGWSGHVSGLGDINGDGFDDIGTGSHTASPLGRFHAGEVHILFGSSEMLSASGEIDLATFGEEDGLLLIGVSAGDNFGTSLSGAGDVNGDGLDDFLVGASGSSVGVNAEAGRAYLIWGTAEPIGVAGVLDVASFEASVGVRFDGHRQNLNAGWNLRGAGDVDGDGFADLLIGTETSDTLSRTVPGEAYLVYGSPDGIGEDGVLSLGALTTDVGAVLFGAQVGDAVSRAVSTAGDVNGDGLSDFIAGAYWSNVGAVVRAGQTYLIHGAGDSESATYSSNSRAGTARRRGVGMIGNGSHSIPLSRAWLAFDAGEGPGPGNSSRQTVTLTRSNASIDNLGDEDALIGNVLWEVSTDRDDYQSADLWFKYLDSEVPGLLEVSLQMMQAPTPSGPWSVVEEQSISPGRNEVHATLPPLDGGTAYFALADLQLEILITFDDQTAPCLFRDASALRDTYDVVGVTFEGPGELDGGAILNACSSYGVVGHSSPNFLAFNQSDGLESGGNAIPPETIHFDRDVVDLQLLAGAGLGSSGGLLTVMAFDASDELVDSTEATLSGHLQSVSVEGDAIRKVVLDFDRTAFVIDDLLIRRAENMDADAIVANLLGVSPANSDLDVNHDGSINAADVVSALSEGQAPLLAIGRNGSASPQTAAPMMSLSSGAKIMNGALVSAAP
jgi:hypothetical protein